MPAMLDVLLYHPVVAPGLGMVLGAILGSFIAALAVRWPLGQSVRHGRSHCETCGKTLTPGELLPILSWLVQRGACRACGAPIGRDALAIELIAALIGGASMLLQPGWTGLGAALFGWLLLPLAWLDLRHYWLPDRLVLVLAVAGAVWGFFHFPPLLVDRIIGGIAGFFGLAFIASAYRVIRGRDGLGKGDPKLFGAIGIWLGWAALPFALLIACGIGLLAVLLAMVRGERPEAANEVPLGALLALGAWPLAALPLPL